MLFRSVQSFVQPGADGIASATYYAGTNTGAITIRATVGTATTDVSVLVTNIPVGGDTSQQEATQRLVSTLEIGRASCRERV